MTATRVYTIRLTCGHTVSRNADVGIPWRKGDHAYCESCERFELIQQVHVYHGWKTK